MNKSQNPSVETHNDGKRKRFKDTDDVFEFKEWCKRMNITINDEKVNSFS